MRYKITSFIVILCALIISCANKANSDATDGKFTITGKVADSSCDGAQIFLVPLTEPATHETVDSVVIKDGQFFFEGTKTRVAALRLQMPQRMKFQELLVYTEPGNIKAYVAPVGSVSGTRNNDLLQQWKTVMEGCVSARRAILDGHRTINSPGVRPKIDSLNHIVGDATYKMIKESGVNPFSRFFYMGNRSNLSDQQKMDLKDMEEYYQQYVDSIRKDAAARNAQQDAKK